MLTLRAEGWRSSEGLVGFVRKQCNGVTARLQTAYQDKVLSQRSTLYGGLAIVLFIWLLLSLLLRPVVRRHRLNTPPNTPTLERQLSFKAAERMHAGTVLHCLSYYVQSVFTFSAANSLSMAIIVLPASSGQSLPVMVPKYHQSASLPPFSLWPEV